MFEIVGWVSGGLWAGFMAGAFAMRWWMIRNFHLNPDTSSDAQTTFMTFDVSQEPVMRRVWDNSEDGKAFDA